MRRPFRTGERGSHKALPAKTIHVTIAPNVRQVVRNLIIRNDGIVEAGYRLGPARWDYTGYPAQVNTLDAVTDIWALLAGHDVRERVTTRPHPVQEWARRLDMRTPHPIPDDASWNEHLTRMQHRISVAGMDDKIGTRMLSVGEIDPEVDVRAQVLAHLHRGTPPSAEVRSLLSAEKRIADAVAGAGWRARRMTPAEIGWLHQRSLAPGMRTGVMSIDESGMDGSDLEALANDVRWLETPWDRTVEVRGWLNGVETVRHVQVLTCSRLDNLKYPENGLEPWQAFAERAVDADRRPFSVEWNIVGRVKTGEELASQAALDKNKAINVAKQYEDFEEPPPAYTQRGIDAATEAEDQITTGQARDAARFVGTIQIIVSGEEQRDERGRVTKSAADVVEERADAVKRLFGGNELRMMFTAPHGQAAWLRESIPGQPFDATGYQRQIRLPYLAAGLPNVSTSIGDGEGPYLGYTLGASRRPVMHDPQFATEGRGDLGRGNNMWPVIGALGSGKSVLLDSIAYNAARRDVRVVIRDPSGPMAALCAMPELAAHSTAINLLRGASGILNVPALVREPQLIEFADAGTNAANEFYTARQRAATERWTLVVDVARRMLDHDLSTHSETRHALREAARAVNEQSPWSVHHSLWDLVDALHKGSDHARILADALTDLSNAPVLALMFPPREMAGDFAGVQHSSTLTVISTPGIKRAPDGVPDHDWTQDERAADVVLRLTSLYTDRELFGKTRDQPAVAIFDEAEDLTDSGVGRGYLSRLGRDHSKWNIAVYLALKSIGENILSGELRNFIAGAFIGRQANLAVAELMLEILNIEDKNYARNLLRLSDNAPGEFLHLDAAGFVGGLKVDVDYYLALRDVVLTNPNQDNAGAWRTEATI